MTWHVIARQDGSRTVGARSAKVLLGVTVFTILLAAYVYPVFGAEPITTARFTGFVSGWLATLLPVVGIILSYGAVASERESGALLLSLSLPHSRDELVFGKAIARTGLLAAAILAAMAGAAFLVVYPFGELELVRFLAFVLVTIGFAAIWTGLGVAVSVAASTKTRALVPALGLYFLFVFVWDTMEVAMEWGLNTAGVIDGDLPGAVQFGFGLSPISAFLRVTDGFIDPSASVEGPWYLTEWVALVVFVCWIVVPLGLANGLFAGRDLT